MHWSQSVNWAWEFLTDTILLPKLVHLTLLKIAALLLINTSSRLFHKNGDSSAFIVDSNVRLELHVTISGHLGFVSTEIKK